MADWLRGMAVGDWYQAASLGDGPFEVVAVDVENEVVLVQHFDGTLEEFDFDSWMELGARPSPPPEDWTGALDVDKRDAGLGIEDSTSSRWEDPLDLLDHRHS